MKPEELLDRYIRARYPIIGVVSHEEKRVLSSIMAVAKLRSRHVVTWSLTQGLKQEKPLDESESWTAEIQFDEDLTREIVAGLETILNYEGEAPVLFILKDAHGLIGKPDRGFDPVITRYLRDIANKFETSYHNVVMLSPALFVPPDLDKTIVLIDWALPDLEELRQILSDCEQNLPSHIPVTLNGNRELVVQAMQGLTAFEASSVLLYSIASARELGESCIPFIVKEKAQIIKKSGVLEYYDNSTTMNQVGGLENLKRYAKIKKSAFSSKARQAGVDAPKGVLLVGVPGTGKSLSAKAIAGGTMPLLRMDIGAIMGGHVGESESNIRQALKVAEAVAPCVLWMDEIEKAIGGVESSAESDGGTLARVFGTLLTWMQETSAPVYTVATANDVRSLKPELLRRFDDVVWVDLPNATDRRQILTVHLQKRGYNLDEMSNDEVEKVISATWGFSGAEIEKVVKSAIESMFFDEADKLDPSYLIDSANRIIPISVTMGEKIENLRSWAKDRAIFASDPIEAQPKQVVSAKSRMSEL